MAESVVTNIAKEKMLKARAGITPLSKIVGMAFGDGATESGGEILAPIDSQTALHNELLRKPIDRFEVVSHLVYRYICTLSKNELANKYINEMALYDEDGDIVAIETFLAKGKDGDREMGFEIDDTF